MTDRYVLREYESALLRIPQSAARDVVEASGGKITAGPGPEDGTWVLTASGYVGTVVTPAIELLIRPKIPLHNLFLLLDVGVPVDAWRDSTFGFDTDRSLLAALAAFYVRTAERALARGVRHDYRAEEERVVVLRGRIDLAAQLRTPGIASPIACRFDEYTADIVENRALRAAARRLLRLVGIDHDVRRSLERVVATLEDVSDVELPLTAIDNMTYTRLNRHYEPAVRLAKIVLQNTSLIDRVGSADASAFLLDMPILFQRWLTARLRRHLRGRLDLRDEPRIHLGVGGTVPMEPDLVFHEPGAGPIYAGDVKYKLTSDGRGRNDDYYQLFSYLTALRLTDGVLIYCQADAAPEREVVVRHAGVRLRTYPLSLSGSPADVEASVVELADWLGARARATSANRA